MDPRFLEYYNRELQHVRDIGPDRLTPADLDRMSVIEASHAVPGHDAIPAYIRRGETGQCQRHLLGRLPPRRRVHDQGSV